MSGGEPSSIKRQLSCAAVNLSVRMTGIAGLLFYIIRRHAAEWTVGMAYQVLYRKWRPQTFSDVYGQELIVSALRGEMRTGRMAHAYLFVGSRGTGKTSCAKILAKAVNCLDLQDGDPCNRCDSCTGIDAGAVLDVVEIDAASNNGVDNIRDLREEINFTPASAKFRVYIIDEVHMLSPGAFNALLKTLEEPPEHAVFILATTEAHKLPATILSRCQRFDFGRIAPEAIAARIGYIAEQEDFMVAPDAAMLIARLADGGMRDALSLLDLCVSRANDITVDTVSEVAGIAGREHLFSLSAAVRAGNAADAMSVVDMLYNGSKDMEVLCGELISFYRSLMIIKSVPEPDALIAAPPSEIEQLRGEAEGYGLDVILRCIETLQKSLERLKRGVSRRIEMEMTVLRLCMPEIGSDTTDLTALSSRVAALEKLVKSAPVARYAQQQVPAPPIQAPAPTADLVSPDSSAQEVPFEQWDVVLEALAESSPPLYGVLQGSSATVRGDFVLIQTDNTVFRSLVATGGNKAALTAALAAATGKSYRIGAKKSGFTDHAAPPAPDPLSALLDNGRSLGVEVSVRD